MKAQNAFYSGLRLRVRDSLEGSMIVSRRVSESGKMRTYASGDRSVDEVVLVYWILGWDIVSGDIAPKLCEREGS